MALTKKEFIDKIKKSKGVVEYQKRLKNFDVKFRFTNMSKGKKEWYKLELWTNQDSNKMEKVWSYQSSFIADIINNFNQTIFK